MVLVEIWTETLLIHILFKPAFIVLLVLYSFFILFDLIPKPVWNMPLTICNGTRTSHEHAPNTQALHVTERLPETSCCHSIVCQFLWNVVLRLQGIWHGVTLVPKNKKHFVWHL